MSSRDTIHRALFCITVCLLLGAGVGCSQLASVLASPTPLPVSTPTERPSPSAPVPSRPVRMTPAPPGPELLVWVADEFVSEAGLLAGQLTGFGSESAPEEVIMQLKGTRGSGGLVSLLVSSAPVAPSVLPDLAIVDASQAAALAQLGLASPWSGPVLADESDSFPLAQELGYYGTQRIGIPLALDVQHLVYDTNDVLVSPTSWRAILGGRAHYLFPAAGKGDALDALMIQYAMAAGDLVPVDREFMPLLRESPLVTALARYQGMRMAGVAAPEALEVESVTECWSLYLANRASISQVWATDYLAQRRMLQRTRFAPIPTSNGTAMTVGRGWLVVATTRDPARRENAVRLVNWWRTPEHSASLCTVTGWLPPDRKSFSLWRSEDPYYAFLQEQLEAARPGQALPSSLADALSDAISEVLAGELTAQQAATQVLAARNP